MEYNKQIDGLRAFAVIGVLICHFIPFENPILKSLPFGQGVNLFFIISGYLITKILLVNKYKIGDKKTSIGQILKAFYYRRTLRIFPIYYLTIFYLLFIDFQNTREVWSWLVTYTTNIYVSIEGNPYIGSFNHLWSLAVEEQFYLIWPLLILLLPNKIIGKFIVFTILLSLAFKVFWFFNYGPTGGLNALTISCADSLGLGALIGYWSINKNHINKKLANIKLLVVLSFIPFTYVMIYPKIEGDLTHILNNFLFSIFGFAIVIKASERTFSHIVKFLLENKISLHLGKISYGIYLYHFFMPDFYNQMSFWFPQLFENNGVLKTPFLFLSSIVFAQISFSLIEKPILKLKKKIGYSF